MNERDPNSSEDPQEGDWPGDRLAEWTVPAARAEFRASLRAAFLSGADEAVPGSAASGPGVAALERELAPYLEALDAPPAEDAFVQDLRDQFLEGPIPGDLPDRVPASARRLSLRWRLLMGSVAAAAAAWLILVRPFAPGAVPSPPLPGLHVVPGSYAAAGSLSADGMDLAALGDEEIDARLSQASTIATGSSSVRVRFDDYFVVELAADSQMTWVRNEELAGDSDRSGARDFALRSDRGSLRVATGPAFEGSRMIVEAPFLDVEVVGTVFGVDVYDNLATCLCCTEGIVEVRPRVPGRAAHRVAAGYTSLVGPDVDRLKEIPSEHGEPLAQLALFWE